jgi:hypothetical protein
MHKQNFFLIGFEVLVCFTPVTLAWILAALTMPSYMSTALGAQEFAWADVLLPGFVVLGGCGILGVVWTLKYLSCARQSLVPVWIYMAIAGGMFSCLGMILISVARGQFHYVLLIFIAPIISAAHLLYQATKIAEKTPS